MPIQIERKREGLTSNIVIGEPSSTARITIKTYLQGHPTISMWSHVYNEDGEYVPTLQVTHGFLKGREASYFAQLINHVHAQVKWFADDLNDFERDNQRFVDQIQEYLDEEADEAVALYLPLMPSNLSDANKRLVVAKIARSGRFGDLTNPSDVGRLDKNIAYGLIQMAESIPGTYIADELIFNSLADFVESAIEKTL